MTNYPDSCEKTVCAYNTDNICYKIGKSIIGIRNTGGSMAYVCDESLRVD